MQEPARAHIPPWSKNIRRYNERERHGHGLCRAERNRDGTGSLQTRPRVHKRYNTASDCRKHGSMDMGQTQSGSQEAELQTLRDRIMGNPGQLRNLYRRLI